MNARPVPEGAGAPLWTPPALGEESTLGRYLSWLAERRLGPRSGERCSYEELWRWSVQDLEGFWATVWDFFDVRSGERYGDVLADSAMPGAVWFPGTTLNWAEHILRAGASGETALIHLAEDRAPQELTWGALRGQVGALAAALRRLGVGAGDRVVGYLPNIPEAVVAVLACASVGAVWSACAPEFGAKGALDRFGPLEPVVLLAADGLRAAGRPTDRRAEVAEIGAGLPSLRHLVRVPVLEPDAELGVAAEEHRWDDLVGTPVEPVFDLLPFDHPLWVLHSSGTTGLPKGLVHSHGGILLEQLKTSGLQLDLRAGDRFFWYTSTSWMMWNYQLGALLQGAVPVLYDGSPGYPRINTLWRIAEECAVTHLGVSPAYLAACQKVGAVPGEAHDLSALRMLGVTGSPLSAAGYEWVYEAVSQDVWLNSTSGGTDMCTAFVAGSPLLPVYPGELQCRALGCAVEAWDESGRPVVDAVGELVLTAPMPSMPVRFWDDPYGSRYREAYFDVFPGTWRHGDWCTMTSRGSLVIHGRSDSTLNRQGVRMGSADIHDVVDRVPGVVDSLVVGVELAGGGYWMPLFVRLEDGSELDAAVRGRINAAIRASLTERHVPDEIVQVPGIPRTRTGKRLEVPVKRMLQGGSMEATANPGSVADPRALTWFAEFASRRLDGRSPAGVV